MSDWLEQLLQSSSLQGETLAYLEPIFESYQNDPGSVDPYWRSLFDGLPVGHAIDHSSARERFLQRLQSSTMGSVVDALPHNSLWSEALNVYRRYGHLQAKLNPLADQPPSSHPVLSQIDGRLRTATELSSGAGLPEGWQGLDATAFLARLQSTYAGVRAIEADYVSDPEERDWLYRQYDDCLQKIQSPEMLKSIYKYLASAELLETHLNKKYVGQKRFSLEGGEAVVPMLRLLVFHACRDYNVQEAIVGMAHRGRLNVMLNVVGSTTQYIYDLFEGRYSGDYVSGDVKYHMGFSALHTYGEKQLKMTLACNPSHLEFVNPVVAGLARSSVLRHDDYQDLSVLPIMIHGDASFSGQGIIMETLNMSKTASFDVGGSIHLIINNQIGFTTDNPRDARTGHHCSDPAKLIEAPVFHVNGDHPEEAVALALLALKYRQRYRRDVVIDVVCYRRHGQNEADEPMMTQPVLYQRIKTHPVPLDLMKSRLLQQGVIDEDFHKKTVESIQQALKSGEALDNHFTWVRDLPHNRWDNYIDKDDGQPCTSGVEKNLLQDLGQKLNALPDSFSLIRQVDRLLKQRHEMIDGSRDLNWGMAELLAYASLLHEGYRVRISGQDVVRGTFSHRFASLFDAKTGQAHTPLAALGKDDRSFEIYNSLLSESAVLGFEYGVSIADPEALVIWEAQFGDFSNGAQVIIDQFITSGWHKWKRMSGLVLLLPHGQEGMGPEHSSARLERYLQLAAQENIQVCVPTTPAQIFHLLRRQMLRRLRSPLIVMTPKSLLRHPRAVSSLEQLTDGHYQRVIDDEAIDPARCRRVVLCSGKIYYDLLAKREELAISDVALVRFEELYPWPLEAWTNLLSRYAKTSDVVWCQEEPANQGAWFFIRAHLQTCLGQGQHVRYIGRDESAAPAGGYASLHQGQQSAVVEAALALNEEK